MTEPLFHTAPRPGKRQKPATDEQWAKANARIQKRLERGVGRSRKRHL